MVFRSLSDSFGTYPVRRLAAWAIDILLVSLACAFTFGPAALTYDPMRTMLVSIASGLVGAVYFLAFTIGASRTPGLMIMRGSISLKKRSSIATSALFGAMLLPFGFVLLLLEPMFDIFGEFGAEVVV